ncbi:MAG: TlpA disulfide reductase family protein [Alphaproteobacteria bacterium]|nr:TlpA disulfide reductase family protein [Alphaproteobacteria bacterium]
MTKFKEIIRARFVPIFAVFLLAVTVAVIIAVRHNLHRDLGNIPSPRLAAPPSEAQNKYGIFIPTSPPRPMPDLSFDEESGKKIIIRRLTGQIRIFNYWATWCAPCVAELPSLQRLADRKASIGVNVIAVSIDRGGFSTIAPFLKQHGLDKMMVLSDAAGQSMTEFSLKGLPTSILYNRQGEEIGRIEGEYNWDSPEVDQLIDTLIAQK